MKLSLSLLFLVLFGFNIQKTVAQDNSILDSLLLANKYTINIDKKGFSGEGIDYIIENTKNAQFVGIAENHNVKQIPLFSNFLFNILQKKYNFNYMALEQDPVMMRLLSEKKYKAIDMAKKYKNGFTFISDQEIQLIQNVIDQSNSKGNSVWGCDQSFGASHALKEIIADLRLGNKENKLLKNLLKKSLSKEEIRDLDTYHYMSELDKEKRTILKKFKQVVSLHPFVDSEFYINSLLISDTIYGLINNDSFYQSRAMRENYMKSRFVVEYKRALQEDSLPKAVLKFGHFHLMDGFNTGSLTTNLGNMARSIASYNEKETLMINTQVYRDDNSDWDYLEEAYPNFTKLVSVDSWVLFDLKPLRTYHYNGLLESNIKEKYMRNFVNLIYRFDMLLIIGNGSDATWKITGADY